MRNNTPHNTATAPLAISRDALTRRRTIMLVAVAAVTAVDLSIKYAVAISIPAGQQRGPLAPMVNPEFTLGVAGTHHAIMVGVMALGVAAAATVAIPLLDRGWVPATAAGLTIGGAFANTVDRAVNGAVQDYLAVGQVVLNLADIAVVIGMATAGYTLLRNRMRPWTVAAGDQGSVATPTPLRGQSLRPEGSHIVEDAGFQSRTRAAGNAVTDFDLSVDVPGRTVGQVQP